MDQKEYKFGNFTKIVNGNHTFYIGLVSSSDGFSPDKTMKNRMLSLLNPLQPLCL
jgi:hypothetical protein